ncbi:MAG: hypothetical protein IPG93_04705 [Burkholderiales bacterium]|nr:hypothetical protein [Burkholderiales bacterium]
MTTVRPRLGLSFEVAPPQASHPLRTDIACFVGTVARRHVTVVGGLAAMPQVLQRWLVSHRIDLVGGVPLARLRVSLDAPARFVQSLLAAASDVVPEVGASEREVLAGFFDRHIGGSDQAPTFAALLQACRELSPVPAAVLEDLRLREFQPRGLLGGDELGAWLRLQCLHNLPVTLDSFDSFDALFAWEQRGLRDRIVRVGDPVVATPLGIALRAFFGEGGRRAYVVRTGDPSDVYDTVRGRFAACFPERAAADGLTPFDDDIDRCPQLPGVRRLVRLGKLAGLIGTAQAPALSASDWVGLEHVYGLPDVSFVVLPDLIDACAQPLSQEILPADEAAAPERFVDCVDELSGPAMKTGRLIAPPRLNMLGLEVWRQLQLRALNLLDNPGRSFHRRDVQLIASLPLLGEGRELPTPAQWLPWMASNDGWLAAGNAHDGALLSDHLQLAYPWLRTSDSADAQGGVEAPEGCLAGVLARSALERGSYRSAARSTLLRWQSSEPLLPWAQATQQADWTPLGSLTLAERVCLLGPSPRGPMLLSDVTCSADPQTRQGAVRRLVNVVIQAARNAGDEFAFDPSGEALWSRVRARLSDLMRLLLTAGALSTDGVPFVVRCGRDTMQQADIDAGRLIVQIELLPAQPIQRIVVVLNLRDSSSANSSGLSGSTASAGALGRAA